jgi:hypothetical protein
VADTDGLGAALDRLTEEPERPRGQRCTVGAILASLDDATADKLNGLLDTRMVTSTRIADVLTNSGYPVQAPSVARHRRRGASNGCRCPR